jgi:hypothetical protein
MSDLERVIAGALFDFGGFLTTRRGSLVVGEIHNASPIVELIQEFAKRRNLDLTDADVSKWREAI